MYLKKRKFIKEKIKSTDDVLNKYSEIELDMLSETLLEGEYPVKDFLRAEVLTENNSIIDGRLLITNKSIMFYYQANSLFNCVKIPLEDIVLVAEGFDSSNRESGMLTIYTEELCYFFIGLMRFGLSRWVDYISKNIQN